MTYGAVVPAPVSVPSLTAMGSGGKTEYGYGSGLAESPPQPGFGFEGLGGISILEPAGADGWDLVDVQQRCRGRGPSLAAVPWVQQTVGDNPAGLGVPHVGVHRRVD